MTKMGLLRTANNLNIDLFLAERVMEFPNIKISDDSIIFQQEEVWTPWWPSTFIVHAVAVAEKIHSINGGFCLRMEAGSSTDIPRLWYARFWWEMMNQHSPSWPKAISLAAVDLAWDAKKKFKSLEERQGKKEEENDPVESDTHTRQPISDISRVFPRARRVAPGRNRARRQDQQ